MSRALRLGLCFVLVALLGPAVRAAETLPPASRWVPKDAVVVVEVGQPRAVLDLALSPKVCNFVATFPQYKEWAAKPDSQQFFQILKYVETRLDTDWKTGLHKLLDGGITLALLPNNGLLAVIDAEDPALLQKFHDLLLEWAKSQGDTKRPAGRALSTEVLGVTQWSFGDEVHALLGRRLLLANRPEILKAALELRQHPQGASMASVPAFQAAAKAVGSKAAARAYVNLALLKKSPEVQQGLKLGSDPMSALLFAGLAEAVRQASWLGLGLQVEGETLSLEAVTDASLSGSSGAAAFTWPSRAGDGALPNFQVKRQIAGLSFYRDLHGFYAAKDKLFPERTSGLIFFENMMGIFFSGRDLTEEVLGETQPELRLVVAGQEYDKAAGTPHYQLPGIAAVFHLRHPQEFIKVVEEAWQKMVGLISVGRGQKAMPGLIIDRDIYGGIKYSVAYFGEAKEFDKEYHAARLNFRPSLARVGDFLILSTTEALTRDLIDALKQEAKTPAKAVTGAHTLVQIDGAQLAAVLEANRNYLVSNNMVEKAHSQKEAEAEIGTLIGLAHNLGQAKLSGGSRNGRPRVNLEITLNLP